MAKHFPRCLKRPNDSFIRTRTHDSHTLEDGETSRMTMPPTAENLRQQILDLTREYSAAKWPEREFRPGVNPVPVSGKVFDDAELALLVDSSLDFWLTAGRFTEEFEKTVREVPGNSQRPRHELRIQLESVGCFRVDLSAFRQSATPRGG